MGLWLRSMDRMVNQARGRLCCLSDKHAEQTEKAMLISAELSSSAHFYSGPALVVPIAARTPPFAVHVDGQARAPSYPTASADKFAELRRRNVFRIDVLQCADPAALLLEVCAWNCRLNKD